MKNRGTITTMWSVLIMVGLLIIGACGGGGGTENFLQGNGKIAVTVKNSAGTALQNVQIDVFTDAARTHKVDTAVTDANGAHNFQETIGSDYYFTFTDLTTPARFTSPNNWPTKVTPLLTATVNLDVVLPATGASTVSGVAASGAPVGGTAFLKDAANNPEMSVVINAQTGAFSFNVTGKTPPFLLRTGSMYSMNGGSGTANINPLSNLMVAEMGAFTNMSSLNSFYNHPDGTKMHIMFSDFSSARNTMRQTMAPLFATYGVVNADPIMAPFTIGQGMDKMFDDVKMTINANGNVAMGYVSGTTVYAGPMGNMGAGTMMSGNIVPPTTITPSGITITPSSASMHVGATQQFTANIPVTWSVVNLNGGTITSTGLYTAPSVQGMFLVKATSNADPTKSMTVTVMVVSMGMMM